MKLVSFLSGVLICCGAYSCQDELAGGCEEFTAGLLYMDVEKASDHINYWLEDLPPSPVSGDPIGHKINLDVFVDRLQSYCSVQVELGCYACIETYPPQSHVTIRLDSAGTEITRTLDIRTPSDTLMTLLNIHL
jgi:hypothetical protein